HALQVWIYRGVYPGLDQIALLDQRRDLWALDHHLEDAAEASAITATRCCGSAEQNRVGIALDDLAPRHRGRVMALIHDEQIGGGRGRGPATPRRAPPRRHRPDP